MGKYSTEIKIMLLLIVIFGSIILLCGGYRYIVPSTEEEKSYLIFYDINIWQLDGDKIIDISDKDEITDILNNYSFDIYSENNYLTNAKIRYVDTTWRYVYGSRLQFIKAPMIAYYGKTPITVSNAEVKSLEESDIKLLNQYAKQKNYEIPSIDDLTTSEKFSFDFDNDGKNETIYSASNFYKMTEYEANNFDAMVYQIVLYVDGTNVQVISNDYIPKREEWSGKNTVHQFFSIIKLPNQDNYGIVLNKYRSMGGLNYCPTLYLLKEGKFEQVKTCKEMES